MYEGGALALYTSLTCPLGLGATFVLSGFLLAPWEFQDGTKARTNSSSPILICHGMEDLKVPLVWAEHCHNIVSAITTSCKLKKYVGLGHEVNPAVQHDLQMFLSPVFISTSQSEGAGGQQGEI